MTESDSQAPESSQRPQRTVRRPDYYGYAELAETGIVESAGTATLAEHCPYSVQEPETIDEALSSPHAKEWKLATDTSINLSLKMTRGIWLSCQKGDQLWAASGYLRSSVM